MAITYSWTISALDCYPAKEGQENVVFTVHWRLNGTDGTIVGSLYGSLGVTYTAGEPFTPYTDLTQDQIIGWITTTLGADEIAILEANVAQQIANKANPPVISPALPWATEPTP